MKETILFVSNNSGGVNALFPVIRTLKEENKWNIISVTSKFGKDMHKKNKIPYIEMDNRFSDEKYIDKFLGWLSPKILVTGSSLRSTENGNAENYFRRAAKIRKTCSISIIDNWKNYRHRFSSNKDESLDCLPDVICTMDDFSKKQMILDGIPEDLIEVTGQPYFKKLYSVVDKLKTMDTLRKRRAYGIGKDDFVVTYISEPISEEFNDFEHISTLKFNEYDVIRDIVKIMESDFHDEKISSLVIIRLHPREKKEKYTSIINQSKLKIIEDSSDNPYDLFPISNLVIGITSMLLIESFLLNCRSISYQPTEVSSFKFSFPIHTVVFYDELREIFMQNTRKKPKNVRMVDKRLIKNATRNICKIIKRNLL